ncbi:MAG: Pseudouridine synthase, Rsu [Tardiphaga sp.]|nr:Pseudouridine synthase, Rsu [Tardiphaga sp.]
MPRDNDKNDGASRGRRDRPSGGKGRSGAARGPEKKFANRGFAGKPDGAAGAEKKSYGKKPYSGPGKPYAGKREGPPPRRDDDRAPRRDYGDAPRRDRDDAPRRDRDDAPRPARFNREDRPARSGGGDRPDRGPRKDFRPRDGGGEKRPYTAREGGGDKRPYTPRGDRPNFNRDDRAPRGDRGDARPAARFSEKKFGDKKPYAPRGDRPQGDRPYSGGPKKFGDKKFSRGAPDRGPRKDFGSRPDRGRDRGEDRGESKPWQKRDASSPDHAGRNSRPSRDGARNFDKPSFDKPRFDKPREEGGDERPRFSRPREDRPQGDRPRFDRPREDRPKFDRPREARSDRPRFDRPREDRAPRSDWQEHPRSEPNERPRRDGEDDTKIFAKRPAFGGRGAYRERKPDERRPPRPPAPKKPGERIAKVVSRAGLCSRRDAEEWIVQGRVAVNGRVINSPALDVTVRDVITVDGKPLPAPERTRLFLFHKPRGLMTTHADPEGRPTVFDNLPEGLPRLISIGRLDFNTEGLLLLTNDGGLARTLELPDTGWLRRYRVRAHGEVTQGQLDELKKGVEVDGVKYSSIDATLERDQGANVWLVFAIREGKNREVRNVLAHLGLEVNRLIRISYGPFQLGELEEGQVEEVKTRVLREQLGEKIAAASGADFARQVASKGDADDPVVTKKPVMKRGVVEDRKGRRVLVQRSGSDEARARNELEAGGYGPPKRPKRGYHGKRDIKPRDE